MSEFREDISFYTYPQYLNLVSSLVEEGSTTGDEPTESRIAFTKLNLQRMNRWDRQLILDQKLVSEAQHAPKQYGGCLSRPGVATVLRACRYWKRLLLLHLVISS